jgi:anti-sigma B factor antagonist
MGQTAALIFLRTDWPPMSVLSKLGRRVELRAAVATLPAEIDVSNADQIRADLLWMLERGASPLVVDMSATTFCGCAGVTAIVLARRRACEVRAELRIVISEPFVRRVFMLTCADMADLIFPSLGAALAR